MFAVVLIFFTEISTSTCIYDFQDMKYYEAEGLMSTL